MGTYTHKVVIHYQERGKGSNEEMGLYASGVVDSDGLSGDTKCRSDNDAKEPRLYGGIYSITQ